MQKFITKSGILFRHCANFFHQMKYIMVMQQKLMREGEMNEVFRHNLFRESEMHHVLPLHFFRKTPFINFSSKY
jgi:hypothetical protein